MASQTPEVTSHRTTALPPYLRHTRHTPQKTATPFLGAAEIESIARRFIINHPVVVMLLDPMWSGVPCNRPAVGAIARDCVEELKGAKSLAGALLRQVGADRDRIATVNAEADIRINQLLTLQESIGLLPVQEG